ncbi:hypothetical protein BOTBODRAFT_105683, partial [Botryobasidium botryosum FD-172 SS1]
VNDLVRKAKQAEYLIESLPGPDPEEEKARRLDELETTMEKADSEYIKALDRASEPSPYARLLTKAACHALCLFLPRRRVASPTRTITQGSHRHPPHDAR